VVLHHSSGSYDDRWDSYRLRFEHKFASRLSAPPEKRSAPIVNVPLEEALLRDPAEVARLCRPQTLEGFVARLRPPPPA
jgi:hypothetical protein